MQFDQSIASLGLGITYFVQVVLAYLTTLLICALIHNARFRVRVWGGFLIWALAIWILLWIPGRETQSVVAAFHSAPLSSFAGLHIALPVTAPRASVFARVAPAIAFLYFSFSLISILYLLLESKRLKSVLRRTETASPPLQTCFERLCDELRVKRCELRLAANLRSPATCYWWRCHILLPLELVPRLNSEHLEDILRHELFHVRQHDYLWDRLAGLSCRVVFFHPLVWLAYRHFRWERELACDYAVVGESSEARLRYAECLTDLARWFVTKRTSSAGISLFSSESFLKVRVRTLLSKPSNYTPSHDAVSAGVVFISITAALLLLPGLGLSLYIPARLSRFVDRSGNTLLSSSRKKWAATKVVHPPARETSTTEILQLTQRSSGEDSIRPLLEMPKPALPVLEPHTEDEQTWTTTLASTKETVESQSHRGVWDETPMPLASPPKWRTLAIGAVTGAIGIATGQVDPDDDDGPRRRTR